MWECECEMIPERPADRASDLIMMNQGWEKLSGHQPFPSGFTLQINSTNSLNKAGKYRGNMCVAWHMFLLYELKMEGKGLLNISNAIRVALIFSPNLLSTVELFY